MGFGITIDVLGYAVPGALALMIARHVCRWRPRSVQASIHHAEELRRQELLHRLTFFLSSLRHIYNKYPAESLPISLQTERQVFLENDFRNLTTLSALPLSELEELFASVQRDCATGKWRGGLGAIEQRVEEGARQVNLPQDGHPSKAEPGMPPPIPGAQGRD